MPRYAEPQAREAVRNSLSYAEALRRLGLRPNGGNHKLFRRYVDEVWQISTDHFDPLFAQRGLRRKAIALEEVLVEHATYSRGSLKRRLFAAGLKAPVCELCGRGDLWRGRRMAVILDHINGVPDDNRLQNLRIVCPNCEATLETHCGRKNQGPYVHSFLRALRRRVQAAFCAPALLLEGLWVPSRQPMARSQDVGAEGGAAVIRPTQG